MFKRKLALIMFAFGGLLASCAGDESTVTSVAINQINKSTCDSNIPSDINGADISSGEERQIDVDILNPDCKLPGG